VIAAIEFPIFATIRLRSSLLMLKRFRIDLTCASSARSSVGAYRTKFSNSHGAPLRSGYDWPMSFAAIAAAPKQSTARPIAISRAVRSSWRTRVRMHQQLDDRFREPGLH